LDSQDRLVYSSHNQQTDYTGWNQSRPAVTLTRENLLENLLQLDKPIFLLEDRNGIVYSSNGISPQDLITSFRLLANCPPLSPSDLGDPAFKAAYGTRYPLYAGSMANGIASEEMVIALGKEGFMGSFGAGGCLPARVEKAIDRIKRELDGKPYLFNLIYAPFEPALETRTVELYIEHGIHAIEASAFLTLTPNLVWYRLNGVSESSDGSVQVRNKIIAKVSRLEVAKRFLQPPDPAIVNQLLSDGKITEEQARLSQRVPMSDDVTVEADSGGHTDNRPLVSILPAIIHLRDSIQKKYNFASPTRIGAAGGIATPASALAAFMMGAAYVTTGSINQGCIESGTSEHAKNLLAQMAITDVAMAPASDMFEMGVKVQVLKRGTMFAMRGQKLYEIYQKYESIEDIPASEREKLESSIFQQNLDAIWDECVKFFSERDPKQVERANQNPKEKMALIFRWYLGLSSRWSVVGEKGREMDYQIWCGPSMGAFNEWVKGTYLEKAENRSVADVSMHLLRGAAYLWRVRMLEAHGVRFAAEINEYTPHAKLT
jgi:PfaD family protein